MLEVQDSLVRLVETPGAPQELREYLDTYVRQHNEMAETYAWLKERLPQAQRQVWEQTLEALKRVCLALDAGFDPYTPPDWPHGPLRSYVAAIPADVREAIDRAIPIFGLSRILIYDPNPEKFVTPRVLDPLALGHIDLHDRRLHFLIGKWDLPEDLKFIEGEKRPDLAQSLPTPNRQEIGEVADGLAHFRELARRWGAEAQRLPRPPQWTTGLPNSVVQPYALHVSRASQSWARNMASQALGTSWKA